MMDVSAQAAVEPSRPQPVAPAWHTLLLVGFLLVFSALGSAGHPGLTHNQRLKMYVITMAMEWTMVAFIVWGLRRRRSITLSQLIGGRWNRPEDFLLDLAIAMGFWIVAAAVLAGLGFLLGMNNAATVKEMQHRIGSLVPNGATEIAVWICLSSTAGFCEEVIFRGYFQQQFAAWLKFMWGGVLLQALVFGASHAYEGWQQMIRIAVFGMMFGALTLWRKSLRPGMIAHATQDIVAGSLAGFVLKNADKMIPK
jgi:membrane protease YdiL (CAAX protease family)